MCDILRSGPSSSIQHCRRTRELDSNLAKVIVLKVHLFPPHSWATVIPAASAAGALFSVHAPVHVHQQKQQ